MLTTEQIEKRKFSLGASDLAAVIGVSPYKTAEDVWSDKVHGRKPGDQRLEDAAYWGDALEGAIRVWYERSLCGSYYVDGVSTKAHLENRWATATPDGLVFHVKSKFVPVWGLEIKNRGHNDKPRWKDHVPCDVAAQCYWGMYVTGLKRWDAVVLLNGNTPLVHTLEWDDEIIRAMVVVGELVWKAVTDKTAPEMAWVQNEVAFLHAKLVNDADEAAFKRAAWWAKKGEGK